MKKLYLVVAVALTLSGCSAGTQTTSQSAEASVTSTPTSTPTPTPTAMSKEEAAKAYLAAVCPSNIQSEKTTTVLQTKPFDFAAAKAEAGALRDAYRTAIETLSDDKVVWPESVEPDIAKLAEGMYEDVSGAQNVANQATEAGLIAAWNGWATSPDRAATAQKIRLKLGLSPDTSGSCAK